MGVINEKVSSVHIQKHAYGVVHSVCGSLPPALFHVPLCVWFHCRTSLWEM